MRVFYTKTYNMGGVNAKKQEIIEKIAGSMNFEEISLFRFPDQCDTDYELNVRMDGIMAVLEEEAVVLFQYPSMVSARYDRCVIEHIKKYRHVKLIIMVQDFGSIVSTSEYTSLDEEINLLNEADLLILQSEKMLQQLTVRGLHHIPVLFQKVWEYPYDSCCKKIEIKKYTDQITDFSDIAMLRQREAGIVYVNACNESYLDMCNPLEIGYCICAGIPLLAMRGTQAARFVEQFGVGFVIEPQSDPEKFVSNISEDEINAVQEHMKNIRGWVQSGLFTKTLLQQAVYEACMNSFIKK